MYIEGYWIGLSQADSDSDPVWDDGDAMNFQDFSTGQPDTSGFKTYSVIYVNVRVESEIKFKEE